MRIPVVATAFLVSSFVFAQNSSYQMGEQITIPEGGSESREVNALVISESRIVIPNTWRFVRTKKAVERNDSYSQAEFCRFNDQVNNVFGFFEYTTFNIESNIDAEALAKLVASTLTSEVTDKILHKTFIGGRDAYIVSGRQKDKNWDYMTALIPEGKSYNEIRLLANEGYLKSNPAMAHGILGSYRRMPEGWSERIIPNGIKFKSTDARWYWQDDWVSANFQGYTITDSASHETPIDYIGIARTERTDIEFVQALISGFNEVVIVPEFEVKVAVGDRQMAGSALVSKNNNGLISLYYFFKQNGTSHLVMICYKTTSDDTMPEGIQTEIRNVLSKYFYW